MSRSFVRCCGLAIIATMMATIASAQARPPRPAPAPLETGGIVGVVADSAGGRIAGAQVIIVGLMGRAETGDDGNFRMGGVPTGRQLLIARRIGFRPESLVVTVQQGVLAEADLRMRATPQQMTPVVVEGGRVPLPTGRLRGFNERRATGFGHYFTAADIEQRNPNVVSDLLRTIPSVRINRQNGQTIITFRGQRCTPLVWLDGAPAAAAYLDPDVFLPSSLAGIEVYPGPATVPAELMWVRGQSACGVIALWTAVPEAGDRRRGRTVTSQQLANLIANLKLYTADQVDTPATPDTANPIAPVYPDSLLRAGATGRTVVEFVVDTAGVPDMDTFGAVASTDALFTASVRRAVNAARFTPAVRAGLKVRQLVQLPITFTIPQSAKPDPAGPGDPGVAATKRPAPMLHTSLRR
jgi:TonB family protein